MTERMLTATTLITTFHDQHMLVTATGFFFRNGGRVYLITSQHILANKVRGHRPNRLEFMVRGLRGDDRRTHRRAISLGERREAHWRSGYDRFGEIDIAAIEIPDALFPSVDELACFDTADLVCAEDRVAVGDPVLMVVFPSGGLPHEFGLPVVRHAVIASSMASRFEGQSCFLTDGLGQRGSSGAPVVVRRQDRVLPGAPQTWKLMGVHSSTFDGIEGKELLGSQPPDLSCNWYADILPLLTSVDLH